jgi:Leucine-rich repeat (LRR) protein
VASGSGTLLESRPMRTSFAYFIIALLFTGCPLLGAAQTSAKKLEISETNAQLLDQLQEYPDLEVLKISCLDKLRSLPDSIGNLRKLEELIIDNGNGCAMNPLIPESIGHLHSLKTLVLYGAQDPRRPGEQPAERHKFPGSMSQLKNLRRLDLGRNGLNEIPEFVKDLSHLQELDFAWNMRLKKIPEFIVNLRELTVLKLDADGLTDLPDFLSQVPKLASVTLGDNCIITKSQKKKKQLATRFPKIKFGFDDEYDCP